MGVGTWHRLIPRGSRRKPGKKASGQSHGWQQVQCAGWEANSRKPYLGELPHAVLPCLAMRPPSKLNKFSCLRTPGRPATAWLLDSATPHVTSLWESWRHGEGEAWIAVFNLLSPPSLQQSMWGPQVECLLASVPPLCTNECNEHCPFFRSH